MKKITIDDKVVEISDESYEAFKKQFVTTTSSKRWKAEYGEKFFCVNMVNAVIPIILFDKSMLDKYYNANNMYKTEELAEMEVLRREARVDTYLPEDGDEYYCWSVEDKHVFENNWMDFDDDIMNYHNGNSFPYTDEGEKQCEEWGARYGKAYKI
jgi:hypothetical protein